MPAPSEAVQRQIDKANDIHAQVYGASAPEETPSDVDVINNLPGAEAEVVKVVDEVKASDPVPAEPETPPAEPEGGDPSPAAPTEAAAGTTDDDESEKFEQRYKVLQGKYNKEVPVLNTQVKELQNELVSMRGLLASLEQMEPVKKQAGDKLLKDDEIADYGSDMIDVIKRAAREELTPEMHRLELENEQLRNALGGMSESVSENARDIVLRSLTIEVPDWKEINQNTGFLEWLEGVDPYSGSQKADMLTQAFENNDAARVIAFFKGYLNENVMVTPPPAEVTPAEPKVDLTSLAAPGTPRGGAAAPSAQAEKRLYTQKDIAEFYRNVQHGMYKDNKAEKEAIERDILAAGREGRLR